MTEITRADLDSLRREAAAARTAVTRCEMQCAAISTKLTAILFGVAALMMKCLFGVSL